MSRGTKIVATIGPASSDFEILVRMIRVVVMDLYERTPYGDTAGSLGVSTAEAIREELSTPVMIVETGSWESGGDKAEWVSNALERELPTYDHIRAFVFWSVEDPRGDLRLPTLLRLRRGGDAQVIEHRTVQLDAVEPAARNCSSHDHRGRSQRRFQPSAGAVHVPHLSGGPITRTDSSDTDF